MRKFATWMFGVAVFAAGYGLGTTGLFGPQVLRAQLDDEREISESIQKKIVSANTALKDSMKDLVERGFYIPAIKGVNAYAVLAGGVDAKADLEAGRGVDPETFVGLYIGQAVDEVAENLDSDAEGRLTYKNQVVRIYPKSRLKLIYAERLKLSGDEG
jgi:hypothetical protein